MLWFVTCLLAGIGGAAVVAYLAGYLWTAGRVRYLRGKFRSTHTGPDGPATEEQPHE